jgi:hypothetical protein
MGDSDQPPERPKCPFPVPLDVCTLFEKLTLEVRSKGWQRYSADAILHRIRWHYQIDIGKRSFKANNNWTAPLARWFMACHPEADGFFELRTSPTPARNDPNHNLEDYSGPFFGKPPWDKK